MPTAARRRKWTSWVIEAFLPFGKTENAELAVRTAD